MAFASFTCGGNVKAVDNMYLFAMWYHPASFMPGPMVGSASHVVLLIKCTIGLLIPEVPSEARRNIHVLPTILHL